jgi:hypothetical protein
MFVFETALWRFSQLSYLNFILYLIPNSVLLCPTPSFFPQSFILNIGTHWIFPIRLLLFTPFTILSEPITIIKMLFYSINLGFQI